MLIKKRELSGLVLYCLVLSCLLSCGVCYVVLSVVLSCLVPYLVLVLSCLGFVLVLSWFVLPSVPCLSLRLFVRGSSCDHVVWFCLGDCDCHDVLFGLVWVWS